MSNIDIIIDGDIALELETDKVAFSYNFDKDKKFINLNEKQYWIFCTDNPLDMYSIISMSGIFFGIV